MCLIKQILTRMKAEGKDSPPFQTSSLHLPQAERREMYQGAGQSENAN